MKDEKSRLSSIRDSLATFGGEYSKSTIQSAISALGNKLEKTRDEIAASVSDADHVLMDETPFRTICKQGYV